MYTFIQQLIKSDSKDIYNVPQKKLNAVFLLSVHQRILKTMVSVSIKVLSSAIVFNIDNNKKLKFSFAITKK